MQYSRPQIQVPYLVNAAATVALQNSYDAIVKVVILATGNGAGTRQLAIANHLVSSKTAIANAASADMLDREIPWPANTSLTVGAVSGDFWLVIWVQLNG